MQIGMIGLGRMGANMVRRLVQGGHECVAYDPRRRGGADASRRYGAQGAHSLAELVRALKPPRARVDHGAGGDRRLGARSSCARCSPAGDVLIDGGNSHYHDDIRRAEELQGRRHPLPGRRHERRRARLRAGLLPHDRRRCGRRSRCSSRCSRRSPRGGKIAATQGRGARRGSAAALGYLHCGPSGAGHFVKMVHNGIEYGLMAAYAEGLNILAHANAGLQQRRRWTPRPRRCPTRATSSTSSTSPRSPRSGATAASSPRGCST